MPIGGSRMRMSEKRITPSLPNRRKGCMETSTAPGTSAHSSRNLSFFRVSRYSGRYLPACRISHTGGTSVGLPNAASRKRLREEPCASEIIGGRLTGLLRRERREVAGDVLLRGRSERFQRR